MHGEFMSDSVRTTVLNSAAAPGLVVGLSPLGARAKVAIVLLSCVLAVAAIQFSLPVFAAVVLAMAVVAGCSALGARPFAVFGLVYSVPFVLTHHFVYRPNVGASDGLAIYLTDFWVIWLLIDAIVQQQQGTTKPMRDFAGFLLPVTFLLVADLISFTRSSDIQLSIYGIIEHFRAALLFVVLAFSVRQGKRELHAALLAIVCAVRHRYDSAFRASPTATGDSPGTRSFRATLYLIVGRRPDGQNQCARG
jgi:hypothetical protein